MAIQGPEVQSESMVARIARLAGPVSQRVIVQAISDGEFRGRIERSTPVQIARDLMVRLGVVGPRPYDQTSVGKLDAYLAAKAEQLYEAQDTLPDKELDDLFQHNAGVVREESGIVAAFKAYREAEVDHWGQHFDIRHYHERIEEAQEIGTFAVAAAWDEIDALS